MKTCPVCQATLFDDMGVCYGCMYEFGLKPDLEEREGAGPREAAPRPAAPGQEAILRESMPVVESKGAPQALGVGSMASSGAEAALPAGAPWAIRLEMRSGADPQATWSMELVPTSGASGAAKADPDRLAEPRLLGVR